MLQIQISKNGLHLKLKLHPLWRTSLCLKVLTKNYFGFTHPSSKVHFRSTEGQIFYWSIMTADDSIKCRCANSGMTSQVGGFQNPLVCLQAFPSFLPHPLPALLLAPFVARSLTPVPRSLLLNRTETLATQAREDEISKRMEEKVKFSPRIAYFLVISPSDPLNH